MHNTPDIAYEKGTKCMLGSFIDIYVLYTYLFRCDLQPCLPGLQVLLNHIFTRVNIRKAGWPNHQKKESRLHSEYNFADLCVYEQDHFLTSVNVIYPFSYIAKLITKNETYISITLIILKYSCFPMLWFNQEKIYFCHHLSCVFLKGFLTIL